ncbi:RHS repeat domain-containing protein [Aquilutibacter rugosus]|uniref:RHS repeat domain-containing protein n=1 Tax=Aquilutibacter rugosus TaxID=3115820 RepID=UPI002F4144B6
MRNAHRELCKQIDPESGATVRDFDAAGNVSWQASGLNLPSTTSCDTATAYSSGRRLDLTWDARNRETARTYPDGLGNATTTYWPDGLVNTQTAYNGGGNTVPVITAHSFNKRRLPITETSSQPGWYAWTVQRGYDSAANPNSITYPNGLVVQYAPNALGQPTQVTASDGTTLASAIQFYPNGALQQFNYGNGIAHTMTQNARQLPARSLDVGVIDENYSYDPNANTTAISDPIAGTAGNRIMTYDLGDRLLTTTAAIFGGDGVHRNSYDALDNIKSWKLTGVKDYATYVYDARNLPTQINNNAGSILVTQSFDAQGNLSSKNGQGYQFDYGNRLRAVSGVEVSRYDAAGRRVMRWPSTGDGLLAMYTADNAFIYAENHRAAVRKRSSFVHLQGSLLATYENNIDTNANAWIYQHTDAIGSPVATTNAAGTVTERTNYEPWGAAIGKPAMDRVGYTGHQMDGTTGLIYMQQRYYDPQIGKFLSTDPVTANSSTSANFNLYWYANNNPFRFTDPDGRSVLTRLIKLVINGGDFAATVGGIVDDIDTLRSSTTSTGEKVLAGASLLSEVISPVSIGDARNAAKSVKMASEKLGGSYSKLKRGEGLKRHHIPSVGSGSSRLSGPAIVMDKADHHKTASWGSSREAKAHRKTEQQMIESGDFNGAQELGIRDIKQKFGEKYDEHIEQMRKYTDGN